MQCEKVSAYNLIMKPKTTIKKLGGIKAAAIALGYTENALRYWLRVGKIPRHAQKWIRIVIQEKT